MQSLLRSKTLLTWLVLAIPLGVAGTWRWVEPAPAAEASLEDASEGGARLVTSVTLTAERVTPEVRKSSRAAGVARKDPRPTLNAPVDPARSVARGRGVATLRAYGSSGKGDLSRDAQAEQDADRAVRVMELQTRLERVVRELERTHRSERVSALLARARAAQGELAAGRDATPEVERLERAATALRP
ncbi:MAG: hypothetical protein HY904_12375 [Deltaproteobacteria bacterium]|nr:hypothetical protein [Deltaproteobacteria bacterium]